MHKVQTVGPKLLVELLETQALAERLAEQLKCLASKDLKVDM